MRPYTVMCIEKSSKIGKRHLTIQEQSRNRRSNINITIGNAKKTLTEWCEIFDMEYKIVVARYHRNPDQTLDELFSPIPR